jgi:hypothetical protein
MYLQVQIQLTSKHEGYPPQSSRTTNFGWRDPIELQTKHCGQFGKQYRPINSFRRCGQLEWWKEFQPKPVRIKHLKVDRDGTKHLKVDRNFEIQFVSKTITSHSLCYPFHSKLQNWKKKQNKGHLSPDEMNEAAMNGYPPLKRICFMRK